MSKQMDFIRDFLNYVEKVGIFDEFDKDTQKMITSQGVRVLIKQATDCLPEKLKPREAAKAMRELNAAERDKLIQDAEEGRVLDMRKHFQEKMSRNGGAQGILEQLVKALESGNQTDIAGVILDAQALVKGPENVVKLEIKPSDSN